MVHVINLAGALTKHEVHAYTERLRLLKRHKCLHGSAKATAVDAHSTARTQHLVSNGKAQHRRLLGRARHGHVLQIHG